MYSNLGVTSPAEPMTDQVAPTENATTPQVATPGYESCEDLRDDLINAAKYLANSIIVGELNNEW
jgi:hypothetical protein